MPVCSRIGRKAPNKGSSTFPLTSLVAFFVSPPPSPVQAGLSRLPLAATPPLFTRLAAARCCTHRPPPAPPPPPLPAPPLQRSMSRRTSGPSTTTHLGIGQQEFNPSPASTRPHHYPLLRHAGTDEQEHRVCLSVPSPPPPPRRRHSVVVAATTRPPSVLAPSPLSCVEPDRRPACVCSPTGASQLFLHLALRVCAGLPTQSCLACLVPPFSRPRPGLAPCCPSLFSILDNRRPDRRRGLTPSPTQTSATTILDWPVAALPCLFSLGPLARSA